MNKIIKGIVIATLLFTPQVFADMYDDAVNNSARSTKDIEVDSKRKPAEVMRFFEIQPGMKVFDVFAGGGYYSELLHSLVGPNGEVVLYNNEPWDKFVSKAVLERLKGNRLPRVKKLIVEPESLLDIEQRYDAAIFVLGMHDLYYADPENGWPKIHKAKFLEGIFSILNKGAVFGVIDAKAESGADNEVVGKALHRVDADVMIKDILAAGFVLEESSDMLANPDDNKATSVFLPENRLKTDRAVLKFRKPISE